MTITQSEIKEIAENTREEYLRESDVQLDWPDCHDVSFAIKKALQEHGINQDKLEIQKYMIDGEIHHYALVIDATITGTRLVIDASFDQFANETSTKPNIAPKEDINEVIVSPETRYIFNH